MGNSVPIGLRELGLPERAAGSDPQQLDLIYERFLTLYEQEWVAFHDAIPTLRALRDRGLRVAVLRSLRRPLAPDRIGGLLDLLDHV